MSPELKTKWVSALRSGKYEQGDGYLIRVLGEEKRYCCLGVLAEISGCKMNPTEFNTEIEGYTKHDMGEFLPNSLADHLGISWTWQEYYAGMNDDNSTFEDIAKDIEINTNLERFAL